MPERPKLPIKELALVWGGNLSSKLMMFVATIYLANKLEVEGFGIYSTAFAVTNYVSLALFTGLDTYATRESAGLREEAVWPFAKRLFKARRRLADLAVLVTAALALFLGRGSRETGMTLILFGLSFLPLQISCVNMYYGLEWPAPIALYFFGGRVVFLSLVLLFVKDPGGLYVAAGAFTAAILLENLYLFFRLSSRYSKAADREAALPEFKAKPILLLTFLTALLLLHENLPQLFVFLLKGEEEAGLYASSFRLIYTAVTFANLGGFVFLARFSREEGASSYNRSRLYSLVLGIAFAAAGYFFSDLVYSLLYSESYAGGAAIMRSGVFQMALVPLRVLVWQYILAKGRLKKALTPLVLGVLVSVGITCCMTAQTGALGAARGLVIGEAVLTALLLFVGR